MSSKRSKIREMKRKQKQHKQLLITGGIAAVVLVAVGIALYMLNQYNLGFIMTFEGRKINTTDMQYCSYFATDEENPKEQSLNFLLQALVMEEKVKENNLSMTEEEIQSNDEYVASYKSYLEYLGYDLSFITPERMTEIMAYMGTYYQKLLTLYTSDYAVDENDFQKELGSYMQNNRADYYDVELKYVFTYEQEKIENALKDLEMGAEFDEVVARYSDYYDEEEGITTYPLKNLSSNLADADKESILAMEVGDISGIIDMSGMYAIFYMDSYSIPDDETVAESYRTQYLSTKTGERFTEIVTGWIESADYKINQQAYDAFTM